MLAIVLIAWIGLRLVRKALRRLGKHVTGRVPSPGAVRRANTLTGVVGYVVTVAVWVVVLLLLLTEVGVSVAPLLGAAGIVGIAVGFGAQTLVKDFFTGFFLLLEDQIRTGDVVQAGGHSGVVEQISLRLLQLRDYEGNVHYIPNSNVTTVTNMSRDFAFAVMDIGVGYGEDTDHVGGLLSKIGQQMRNETAWAGSILDDLEVAGVNELADSAVTIRCRLRCVALDQWKVRREFLARTKKSFDANGIEIPFPHIKVLDATGQAQMTPAAA